MTLSTCLYLYSYNVQNWEGFLSELCPLGDGDVSLQVHQLEKPLPWWLWCQRVVGMSVWTSMGGHSTLSAHLCWERTLRANRSKNKICFSFSDHGVAFHFVYNHGVFIFIVILSTFPTIKIWTEDTQYWSSGYFSFCLSFPCSHLRTAPLQCMAKMNFIFVTYDLQFLFCHLRWDYSWLSTIYLHNDHCS